MTPGPTLQQLIETIEADAGERRSARAAGSGLADRRRAHGDRRRRAGAFRRPVPAQRPFVDRDQRLPRRHEAGGAQALLVLEAEPRALHRAGAVRRSSAASGDARSLGHNYVGTEHLLLGLFEPAGGIAAQVLGEAGITRVAGRGADPGRRARGEVIAIGSDVQLPFTPRAVAVARAHTHRGVVARPQLHRYRAPAARALRRNRIRSRRGCSPSSGVSQDHVRAQVIEKLSGYEPAQ